LGWKEAMVDSRISTRPFGSVNSRGRPEPPPLAAPMSVTSRQPLNAPKKMSAALKHPASKHFAQETAQPRMQVAN
jgi:hypothetical protein